MLSQDQVREIRRDFPILQSRAGASDLVYLDNAATTQKPLAVIESVASYYRTSNANPHRGAHDLANRATELYEGVRMEVAKFIRAYRAREVIFTRSATESLNLLAYSLAPGLKPGDEILISILEHHANLVPWQYVARLTGAKLRYAYLDGEGNLDLEDFKQKLNDRTRIVALTACSNVTGAKPDLAYAFGLAQARGAKTIADLTQLVAHSTCDVRRLNCDFGAFSAHKMYGPMGVGVLWGKYAELEALPPFNYGGDMIERVTEQTASFAPPAARFEAGTMNVGGVVGLGRAIAYLQDLGLEEVESYERRLQDLAEAGLKQIAGVEHYTAVGRPDLGRGAVLPFNIEGVHPHDVATILNQSGVAIRSGHHCAEPLHAYLGLNSTCRASFSFYNTEQEVEQFLTAVSGVRKLMGLA